jgi:CRP/FNR family transcriptional regulator
MLLDVTSPRSASRAQRARNPAPSTDAAVLARVGYFRALPAARLARLATRCRARTLVAGETLFEEGAPCAGLFIVATGRIEIGQTSFRGREQVLHTEGPGATLGEGPLFDGGGYIASAVAREPSRVLLLPRPEVLALCRERPEVALALLASLARRVRRFAGLVSDLAFHSVRQRVARYLQSTAAGGGTLELELTHAQLAARLGTVRELVARALAQLERAGAIERTGKRIAIRDHARLDALALGE